MKENAVKSLNYAQPTNNTNYSSSLEETTSDIRARESKQLRDYLKRLSRPDHRIFISDVIKKAGVERKIFYNWKYGNSRMPSFAKAIIQQLAGCSIFSPAADEMGTIFIPDSITESGV